jgi:hypothetical protein
MVELFSITASEVLRRLREEVKSNSKDLFSDDPQARVAYVMQKEKEWPKGQDLTEAATNFMLSGAGMDFCNIYALSRFNKEIRPMNDAEEAYEEFDIETQLEMARVTLGEFGESMNVFMDEIRSNMLAAVDETMAEAEGQGEGEKKPPAKKKRTAKKKPQ